MTEPKNERQEKRISEKQRLLAEAKDMHEEYCEDGGSLDYVSNMAARNHALALATKLGNPSLAEHCAVVTQLRQQVGLPALNPFELMLSGKLVQRAEESQEEIEEQILKNRAQAERDKLKKDRRNAAGGRITARS